MIDWRTDVENAPRDRVILGVWDWRPGQDTMSFDLVMYEAHERSFCAMQGDGPLVDLVAWSEVNLPAPPEPHRIAIDLLEGGTRYIEMKDE